MIGYIKGSVVDILDNGILFDHDGIGFIIFTSSATAATLSGQNDVTVYTYMNVREDAMELYGFASLEEREFFIKLISVNGVGPKGGINILSNGPVSTLKAAIIEGDEDTLKAPGIGKKTVQKIILELKDKLIKEGVDVISSGSSDTNVQAKSDAVLALISLGYDKSTSTKAVNKVEVTDDMVAEDILKLALKHLL
jgi:Holliday junction DNA helicase RuvA